MTTKTELLLLRAKIDSLNDARVELSIAGHLTNNQEIDLLDMVDALEDRFIALTNSLKA